MNNHSLEVFVYVQSSMHCDCKSAQSIKQTRTHAPTHFQKASLQLHRPHQYLQWEDNRFQHHHVRTVAGFLHCRYRISSKAKFGWHWYQYLCYNTCDSIRCNQVVGRQFHCSVDPNWRIHKLLPTLHWCTPPHVPQPHWTHQPAEQQLNERGQKYELDGVTLYMCVSDEDMGCLTIIAT